MDKDEILARWSEYIGELYNDERGEGSPIKNYDDDTPILEDVERKATNSMKRRKVVGRDHIIPFKWFSVQMNLQLTQ